MPWTGRNAAILWSVLIVVLILCAMLAAGSGAGLPYDLFFLPVIMAFLFFRYKGFWIFIPATALFVYANSLQATPFSEQLWHALFELCQWLIIAAITLATLRKYKIIERHSERIQRDIEMARMLQTALVPRKYDFGRLHIEGMIHQCNDVGGDYYYFRPFQEKYVVFCLGDVMGKGISAAMVMAVVMGFFFEWGKKSPSPSVILEKLNKRLLRLWSEDSARFTTLFYAVFDEESSLLTYSSGGHGPALILRKNGTVEKISGEGLPIGILEGETWDENQVTLEKGDRVFVFTDGLTEARAQDGELFSLDRVIEILKMSQNHSCGQSIKKLRDAAVSFSGGEFSDDMAILAVEVVK